MSKNQQNKAVNAGVHANVGMDFQKHCTIFLILENYTRLKNLNYFILLEHHEDIVFAFTNENNEVSEIETYQAKKSSKEWTISTSLEIVKKIIENSIDIKSDPIAKTSNLKLNQYFSTNNSIYLKVIEKKVEFSDRVSETNSELKFSLLKEKVRNKIESSLINKYSFSNQLISELSNLTFQFIDLGKNSKSQKEQLIGKIKLMFNHLILDHLAAYETILFHLNEVEKVFNQGNIPNLSDVTKRIESTLIEKIFEILTSKSKAYDLWRSKEDSISKKLMIPIFERRIFKLHFENSFDKFKDLKEAQHQKIYRFVESKDKDLSQFYSDEDCLDFLLKEMNSNFNTPLSSTQLKAALFAAYVEIKEISNA